MQNRLLTALVRRLKETGQLPLADIETLLQSHGIGPDDSDVRPHLQFSENSYKRNLVLDTNDHQLVVLCWRPGQGSPIHDHGASNCGIRVLDGVATETLYQGTLDNPIVEMTRPVSAGAVSVNRGDLIHQVENRGEVNLVTLHLYSPPLIRLKS
jgi:cysteine dioxygenase